MESTPEQIAEGESVVRVLAAVLERLIGANSLLAQTDPGKVTKFHALKAPGIGIHQYLERYVVYFLLLVDVSWCVVPEVRYRYTQNIYFQGYFLTIPIPTYLLLDATTVFTNMRLVLPSASSWL